MVFAKIECAYRVYLHTSVMQKEHADFFMSEL